MIITETPHSLAASASHRSLRLFRLLSHKIGGVCLAQHGRVHLLCKRSLHTIRCLPVMPSSSHFPTANEEGRTRAKIRCFSFFPFRQTPPVLLLQVVTKIFPFVSSSHLAASSGVENSSSPAFSRSSSVFLKYRRYAVPVSRQADFIFSVAFLAYG